MSIQNDQKPPMPQANDVIDRCDEMTKNIKNNKSKPFPGNRNAAIIIQRKIAVFHAQISRRMLAILQILSAVCHPEPVWGASHYRSNDDVLPPSIPGPNLLPNR
jgi:hypothetical protein